MRRLVALLTLLVAGLAACDRDARPPVTDVPDSLLVRALAEAHIASARAARFGERADSLRALAFEHVGVDSLQVARALDAYVERPAALARLYGRVNDRLRETQEDLDEARRAWQREAGISADTLDHTDERHHIPLDRLEALQEAAPSRQPDAE